ncbi:MAG: tetratricopeptide repeat protein [Fibrobacter sp.]|nr:tetratricopeptide repeat protein [Fibrobacter sp.]
MSNKKPANVKNSTGNYGTNAAENWLQNLDKEFFQRHSSKFMVVAVIIALGIFGFNQYSQHQKAQSALFNEKMGQAYNFVYENKSDSASQVLAEIITQSKGLNLAKASLLLGNIKFQSNDFVAAQNLYQQSVNAAGKSVLIASAAEHGLAAAAMEQKNYDLATRLLENFVRKYGKRSGNLQERYSENEKADISVMVPDALWKLTLCYNEMQKTDLAKAKAEHLVKVYADSRLAVNARKFLATL